MKSVKRDTFFRVSAKEREGMKVMKAGAGEKERREQVASQPATQPGSGSGSSGRLGTSMWSPPHTCSTGGDGGLTLT